MSSKGRAAGLLCALALQIGAAPAQMMGVIPAPAHAEFTGGTFAVDPGTPIVAAGADESWIAREFAALLMRARGLSLQVISGPKQATLKSSIAFVRDPDGADAATDSAPESYRLLITAEGVTVRAHDRRGLFYGAMTLLQLMTVDTEASGRVTLAATDLRDAPRFSWRGIMLDSARHYQSPEFIERFIDAMALLKLNVLHWHLTDDQGWRLEIRKYPRLTQVGAWRVPAGPAAAADIDPATGRPRLYGGYYSQEQVRKLVAYASLRGITIVPEIEMPGHATAAIVAYPELGVATAPTSVPADWGVYSNLYNVEESTFHFMTDVLDEVLALFPGTFVHVGGDEAVKDQWKASPRVQARMRALGVDSEVALQAYFVRRIGNYLQMHGRRLIGWDEILDGSVEPGAAVMSWRGAQGAQVAAAAGHDTVVSPSPVLYFDNRQSVSTLDPPGRGFVLPLEAVYRFEPMPEGLTPQQQRHVLGLQANVWTEHIRTEERVAFMTFPRAAAVAEIGWSPRDQLDWKSFLQRLKLQTGRAHSLGMDYSTDVFDTPPRPAPGSLSSRELQLCTDKLTLALEDDAPIRGKRAVLLVDIMNPCWIYPQVDLSRGATLTAVVGQLPFNFQLGADAAKIHLRTPATPAGELEVRLGCDGARIAVLPLAEAAKRNDLTQLHAVRLAAHAGRHDLCLTFTQKALDPLWALDRVTVGPP